VPLRRNIELEDVRIVTDRLILRPIELNDVKPIAREFTEQITQFMFPPPARSVTDVAPFIADSIEGLANNTNLQMVAVQADNPDRFVGCVGLHKPQTSTPELGIWIAKGFHGQGLGSEAIEALCGWAAEEIDCEYLKYPVDRANVPSRRITESLGGEIEDEYALISPDGRTLNIVEYRIYPETN
jgi:ribosomal-protein-alanine N-acetyltransferase